MLAVLWREMLYLPGWLLKTAQNIIANPVLVPDALETISFRNGQRPVKVDVCWAPNCIQHGERVRCVTEVDSKLYRRHLNVFWLLAL
ncbi:hypothetical protein DVK00_19080 [Haloarcula sp. Atlit-47R]|nr:hypothetical protein DVK00_19080 [Haloarcula sp. Atlit-47R]